MTKKSLLFALLSSTSHYSQSCKIHGTESGICTNMYLPSTYKNDDRSDLEAITMANINWANNTDGPCRDGDGDHCMPFCGRYIANYYPPCVPNSKVALERDQNFPNGRFQQHTTRSKDRWVEEQVTSIIQERIDLEKQKLSKKRFYKNQACQDAYKRYFCWLNFPRCDEFEETLPMCQSVCANFFRACGYEEDLWRCDNTVDDSLGGNTNYFPGEPFKKNEYENKRKNIPKEVCTPSIKGTASRIDLLFITFVTTTSIVLHFLFL